MRKIVYIALITSLCAIVFLIRYFSLRHQVKSIIEQLESNHNSHKKISVSLTDHLIEKLALEINDQIDQQVETKAEKFRGERELKYAVAGMSHDLRTPLTVIIGYIELIEKNNLSEEQQRHYLSIVKKRATDLQHLINNFFALSTVDTDDYPMRAESIHLNSLLKQILMSYYDQFQIAKEEPTVNIAQEKLTIITDQNALKRVIENILLNALQHSAGDINIFLSKKKSKAILTIKNKMDDINNLESDQLFERFYTIDQTRQYSRGLGLSIVKSLMKKMNGKIFVKIEGGEFNITCMWPIFEQ